MTSTPDELLSEQDRTILATERQWWRYAGSKEQHIRDTFDMTATAYYQRLNELLEDPAAWAWDPLLVKRLRRVREGRVQGRRCGTGLPLYPDRLEL